MKVGLIGAGNMAAALARGWGEPVLRHGFRLRRAPALVEELGGEAAALQLELAVNSDVVVLAHKPAQLDAVAREAAPAARAVVSLLASTTLEELRAAYPGHAGRAGAAQHAGRGPPRRHAARRARRGSARGPGRGAVRARRASCGCPRRCSTPRPPAPGVGPAYWALAAEAWVDAAIRRGIPPRRRAARHRDDGRQRRAAARPRPRHAAVRREVASPGGTTARGLPRSSATVSAPPSRPRWTTSWGPLRQQSPTSLRADPRLHDCIVGWVVLSLSSRSACACPTTASSAGSMDFLRDVSSPYLNPFRRLPLDRPARPDADGRDHRPADRGRHHRPLIDPSR